MIEYRTESYEDRTSRGYNPMIEPRRMEPPGDGNLGFPGVRSQLTLEGEERDIEAEPGVGKSRV